MSKDRQQSRVLLVAVALTFLLGGACAGGVCVHRWWQGRLAKGEFVNTSTAEGPPGGAGQNEPPAALIRVDTARVEEVRPEKRIVGRLHEVRKATLASEVRGKIIAMNVREGSPVVANTTVIASVDKVWLDLSIDRQTARIEAAKAQLRKEKHNLDRLTMVHQRGAATDFEYADQMAAHDNKQAELKEAEVALKELREQRGRVGIVSPFDGWVTVRHAELGQWVSPGSAVVDVISRGEVYAVMNIPESLVNGLSIGMKVPVRIDALGDTPTGTISSITPYGPMASRTYPVRVTLGDDGGRFKVGMSTTATFPAGAKQKRIMVSRDAVLIKPDGATVWVVRPGQSMTATAVPVDVVARVGERFAVAPVTPEGRRLLADAATVVVEGAERLRPDQAVRFMDDKTAKAEWIGSTGDGGDSDTHRAPTTGPASKPTPNQ